MCFFHLMLLCVSLSSSNTLIVIVPHIFFLANLVAKMEYHIDNVSLRNNKCDRWRVQDTTEESVMFCAVHRTQVDHRTEHVNIVYKSRDFLELRMSFFVYVSEMVQTCLFASTSTSRLEVFHMGLKTLCSVHFY